MERIAPLSWLGVERFAPPQAGHERHNTRPGFFPSTEGQATCGRQTARFGNWTSNASGGGGSYVGSTGLSSSSFGIYAGGGDGNSFTAYRPFDAALAVNDTFSVQFQPTGVNVGGSVGVLLFASSVERGALYFNGGGNNWGWNDGAGGNNTNQGFSGAVTLALTRTGTNSYSLALTQNSVTQTITGNFTLGGNPVSSAINEVGFFSSKQGGGQNFGFNNLQVVAVPEPGVPALGGACLLALAASSVRRCQTPARVTA